MLTTSGRRRDVDLDVGEKVLIRFSNARGVQDSPILVDNFTEILRRSPCAILSCDGWDRLSERQDVTARPG
jgi:hypothetical protein